MHDVIDDPSLSKEAVQIERCDTPSGSEGDLNDASYEERLSKIKKKLNSKKTSSKSSKQNLEETAKQDSDSGEDILRTHENEEKAKTEKLKYCFFKFFNYIIYVDYYS